MGVCGKSSSSRQSGEIPPRAGARLSLRSPFVTLSSREGTCSSIFRQRAKV